VRDVYIVQSDPEQARSVVSHEVTGHVQRKLIRARKRERVGDKVLNREFQKLREFVQRNLFTFDLRGKQRCFVIVAQQVLVTRGAPRREGFLKEPFRQNNAGCVLRTKGAGLATADTVKTVAGGHNPCVEWRAFQILTKI